MRNLIFISVFLTIPVLTFSQELPAIHRDTIPVIDTVVQKAIELMSEDVTEISSDDLESAGLTSNISSVLSAGRDPFLNAVAFNFAVARFKPRGYEGDFSATFLNGLPLDNIDNGYTPYTIIGGLNDVMRNRDIAIGLRNNNFAFGDPLISTNIDIRASKQRKQMLVGYAVSNRSYRHRLSATYSSGPNANGWSYSLSGTIRLSDEGYIPGTYYNSKSYYLAVDKKVKRSLFSLIFFGAPTETGRQAGSTEEMKILSSSHYYNPSWGYQNGKKRNANVAFINQPVIMGSWEWKINPHTTLLSSAAILKGERSIRGIDWYNAPDPRPDYYRNLPSYISDSSQKEMVTELLTDNEEARQIDWNRLYQTNYDNTIMISNADGISGNSITGKRSLYVLQDRVTSQQKYSFSTLVNSRISDHLYFTAGASYIQQKNKNFQRLSDLLGGDFYVNLNQFAERDFPNNSMAYQYDIETPNRIVKEGDQFGYDYDVNFRKAAAWWQASFNYRHLDFFVATEFSYLKFFRTGNNRNGLFPENSKGRSAVLPFQSISVKGGFTYKLDGRNYFYCNAASFTRPPLYENVFVSIRTRNDIQDNLQQETTYIAEGGYILNAPTIRVKATGYFSQTNDKMKVYTFYHESYRSFVNYAVSNIDKLSFGSEISTEIKIFPNVSTTLIAVVGRYYYNSRQQATIIVDNTAEVVEKQEIFSKNYRVGTTPNEAFSFTVSYRSPKYWFANFTGNYLGKSWLDINPIRRTTAATTGLEASSEQWKNIVDQRSFPSAITIDFFGGFSYYSRKTKSKKPYYLSFLAGLSNLLNNKNIISGGYEQLRFDFDTKNADQFPPKLFYAQGTSYFISINYRY